MKVNYKGRELAVWVENEPFAEYVSFYDADGELFVDLQTNFSDNPLLGAIWVEAGGVKEELATLIPNILKKTDRFYMLTNNKEFSIRYDMYELI